MPNRTRRTPIVTDRTAVVLDRTQQPDWEVVHPAARWYATVPDAHVQHLVDYTVTSAEQPRSLSLHVLGYYQDHAPDAEAWERGLRHTQALRIHGYDPLILAALRGSGMRHDLRLIAARSGLSPREAFSLAASGTLNEGMIRTLGALLQGAA